MSPAEPLIPRTWLAVPVAASAITSTTPQAINPRDRPIQAPMTRPTPTIASATATYVAGAMRCEGVTASTNPTMPSASTVRDRVKRPSRDRGRLTGGGGAGGAVTRPGYGYGLLTYGPCGANGG